MTARQESKWNSYLCYDDVIDVGLDAEASRCMCRWIEVMLKSQGEIEAAICDGITRFEREYMGRGPKDIRAYLIEDFLVVRLRGVLTAAEKQLVTSLSPEKGRDLLKQVRTHLVETGRPFLEPIVHDITGSKVLSLHHDISTQTGEEVVIFTLDAAPACRDVNRR